MPNWHNINREIRESGSTYDVIRRKYLLKLSEYTERNVIIYYSGWLTKGFNNHPGAFTINDYDKNGFMTVINGLDYSKGLDLILHTPGGEITATESLVDYIKSVFNSDIRVIVPQLAMSAGTMIACSSKDIIMGKHSSLGPIDPQINGLSTHAIIEEFENAEAEILKEPKKQLVWGPIIGKYHPTLVGDCKKAIDMSNEIVEKWLSNCMFNGDSDGPKKAKLIVEKLSDHTISKTHSRHLSVTECENIGLNITRLEGDPELQDLVLTVHHTCVHTLSGTEALKLIENHNGVAFINKNRT